MRLLKVSFIMTAAACLCLPMVASADLIITEVVDATLPGGLPKFVEVTNTGSTTLDLSLYEIGNYSNGSITLGGGASTALSGTLAPCESYVISYENSDSLSTSGAETPGLFYDTYGFDPDHISLGAFTNGDDAYALFLGHATGDGSDATMIDSYGVIGVDGTGQNWEYTDGYSYRNCDVTAGVGAAFDVNEWFVGGANSLETGDDVTELALILSLTNPGVNCVTPCGPVPVEKSTWGGIKSLYK